jgi:4-amino-4-deoxy-L-arabinose transferase-like glycosyltransferase
VVALASHLLCIALIYSLTARLTGSRKAALLAGLIFLTDPHAQQPLWDISFLHVVIQTPLFLTALLAYVKGKRWVALLLAVIGLGVDESGLVLIAIVCLYELMMVCRDVRWGSLKVSLLRLAPFAAVAREGRKSRFDHAARPWYSWIRPPSRSCRRTSRGLTAIGASSFSTGVARARARWGRPRL